ncbi:nucleoside diphosphate kinase regulator [Candidatus Nitrospira bockiana]
MRDIQVTNFDLKRLRELVHVGISFREKDRQYLEQLQEELERAHIVEPAEVSRDVVTMNSRVRVKDVDTGEERAFTLVFPSDAKLEQNKISVLAPIGTAVLGYRVGDIVEWQVPAGVKKLRIEEILYQPEAEGRYDQ